MMLTEEALLLAGCARLVGDRPLITRNNGVARHFRHGDLSIVQSKSVGTPEMIDVRYGKGITVAQFEVRDCDNVVCRYVDREILAELTRKVTNLAAGVVIVDE